MLLRLPTAFAALLSLATVVVSTPADVGRLYSRAPGRVCGTSHDNIAQKEKVFAALLADRTVDNQWNTSSSTTPHPGPGPTTPCPTPSPIPIPSPCPCPGPGTPHNFTVPVYFHVIYSAQSWDGGYIPDVLIEDQIDVLNADFVGTGLSFKLAGTTRTLDPDWFHNVGPDTTQQTDMKNALRVGGVDTLNLYSVAFTNAFPPGLLGYATLPADYKDGPPKDDGVVIHWGSVPGGALPPFNLGRTATHEVGHWVGLYHTFMNGCSPPGDYVDDTPYEATFATGCPVGSNTCSAEGVDPIHNYMDYSDDACMDNFTPGQIVRLKGQIAMFRGIKL